MTGWQRIETCEITAWQRDSPLCDTPVLVVNACPHQLLGAVLKLLPEGGRVHWRRSTNAKQQRAEKIQGSHAKLQMQCRSQV